MNIQMSKIYAQLEFKNAYYSYSIEGRIEGHYDRQLIAMWDNWPEFFRYHIVEEYIHKL